MRLPGLAAALTSFAELGDDFLAGPVGRAIVATVGAHGGVLDDDDLATATAEWTRRRGGAHRRSSAVGDAGADPRSVAARRRRRRGARRRPGAPSTAGWSLPLRRRRTALAEPVRASGTSIVSAADRDGNAVVVVHSNSYPRYGSGLVVGDYDLVLANRAGRGFTPEPGHPNFPAAGRRPATTLHAWAIAGADGRPTLLGGTPGGDNQMPWNAQLLQGDRRRGDGAGRCW